MNTNLMETLLTRRVTTLRGSTSHLLVSVGTCRVVGYRYPIFPAIVNCERPENVPGHLGICLNVLRHPYTIVPCLHTVGTFADPVMQTWLMYVGRNPQFDKLCLSQWWKK